MWCINWFPNVFSPTNRYKIHIKFGTQEAIEIKSDNQNRYRNLYLKLIAKNIQEVSFASEKMKNGINSSFTYFATHFSYLFGSSVKMNLLK